MPSHPIGRLLRISRVLSLTAEHTGAMHLPHLVPQVFLLLTLLVGQHCVEIALGFDPHETQLAFERFAHLGLSLETDSSVFSSATSALSSRSATCTSA